MAVSPASRAIPRMVAPPYPWEAKAARAARMTRRRVSSVASRRPVIEPARSVGTLADFTVRSYTEGEERIMTEGHAPVAKADDLSDYRVALDRGGRGPAGHPERDDIRLLDEDFYVEPQERWAWMRANAPVYWDDVHGIWGLASHEHVSAASRDTHTFCS